MERVEPVAHTHWDGQSCPPRYGHGVNSFHQLGRISILCIELEAFRSGKRSRKGRQLATTGEDQTTLGGKNLNSILDLMPCPSRNGHRTIISINPMAWCTKAVSTHTSQTVGDLRIIASHLPGLTSLSSSICAAANSVKNVAPPSRSADQLLPACTIQPGIPI